MPPLDHTTLLMRKAAQDEYVLHKLIQDPSAPDEMIGFQAQQAVEKMLKAALVARDVWSHRAMRCTILFVVLLLLAGGTGRGQHGTAESGYYPVTFNGQTFSGFVSTVNHDSREITLTYTNPESRKTERFVGVLAAGYTIRTPDRQEKVLDPAKLRIGGHFTFYYYEETRKVEGKKVKINTMFMIRGWPDTRPHYTVFKAFQ